MRIAMRGGTFVLGVFFLGLAAHAQVRESALVESAVTVLDEIMAIPLREIPHSLLASAEGVAIVPNVVKIGFVAGVRRGRGVLLVKDEAGAWTPPQFVTLTGGSVGWQAGLQSTDVILVFKSRRSIRGLTSGTLTLGADAAVAAGPVGRNAGAATDAGLKAEIYTYSRSRGLFAGVSLDGTVLEIDTMAAALYYQGAAGASPGPDGQPAALPPSAVKLLDRLARYSGSGVVADPLVLAGPAQGLPSEESLRRQLAARVLELHTILDDGWRAYLALPPEVFAPNQPPSLAALNASLARFDTVASDPRYRLLAERSEFQAAHQVLRQYVQLRASTARALLALPPPPGQTLSIPITPRSQPGAGLRQ